MAERIRDTISGPITLEYFQQRGNDGWILSAVEWVKPAAADADTLQRTPEWSELPYGQRIAEDCGHLVEDPIETQTLLFIYERVVAGARPVRIATELNNSGHRTRKGGWWTPAEVFDLLPRLIEVAPLLARRPDWTERRRKLQVIA